MIELPLKSIPQVVTDLLETIESIIFPKLKN